MTINCKKYANNLDFAITVVLKYSHKIKTYRNTL